ncbi:MAG TPA: hypothetical protein PKE65_04980 [Rhizobiaceae bacterium]|nr:hypothetical protein [Rhizobiaceae bacterium]
MLWDFSIARTFGLLARTWPYLLLRLFVFALVSLVFLGTTASGGYIGHRLGEMHDPGQAIQWMLAGGAGGFGLASLIHFLVREYILYLVKAGHIAVMVELFDHGGLPEGDNQLAFGTRAVRERFAEANALFAIDLLIRAAVKSIEKLLSSLASFLPIPGLQGVIGALNAVIANSFNFVDEIILAHNIRVRSANPWETSRQALVLYAQNGKAMIRNAVWLTLFQALLTITIALLLIGPFAATMVWMPGPNVGYAVVAAMIAATYVKETLLEPFAVAALMQVYFAATEGQRPDPQWDRRLAENSAQYREIAARARESGSSSRFGGENISGGVAGG